jgi:hypothetical protein
VTRKGQQVGEFPDPRERNTTGQLVGGATLPGGEVELHGLREARHVVDTEHDVVAMAADVREHRRVGAAQLVVLAESERRVALADLDHVPVPVQQRRGGVGLRLDVHGLVAVQRVHDDRQVEPARVGRGEPGVAVGRPLHRAADGVTVALPDVVAHADLVTVVENG